jgi:hypothetical protein
LILIKAASGILERRHRAPSDTLVFDLQCRLRCKGCNRRSGFQGELTVHNCLGYALSLSVGVGRWQFGDEKKVNVPLSGSLKANNGDALVSAAIAG